MNEGDQFTICVCGHQRRYHEGEEMDGKCRMSDAVSCTCTEFRMGPADPPEETEAERPVFIFDDRIRCGLCESRHVEDGGLVVFKLDKEKSEYVPVHLECAKPKHVELEEKVRRIEAFITRLMVSLHGILDGMRHDDNPKKWRKFRELEKAYRSEILQEEDDADV